MPISSSVSRQSATNPGQKTSTRPAPFFPSAVTTSTVYGLSHCALPKRDWNVSVHWSARKTELAREQAPRHLA